MDHANTTARTHSASRREPPYPDTSSIVRTLIAKLAHERSTNRKRIAELEAAVAAAQGQILHLRRQNHRLPDDTA
ncbi:hypothetical protein MOD31_21195 [Paenarthrobacter sp. TYUT067]|uniref:hypothetical protein n=1 Tax=Paenarthrobacter sp. TYUT067 TaxID=2926245 RepID=UPI00202EF122|nr:hypothetical protein [Paenarthrobacter sp. TYUT067]MCM0618547.1 hypothetical protein [Paenarthrobacter sp. TYUT067]